MPKTQPELAAPRWVWSDDLGTAEDVARMAGVKPRTVNEWTLRHPDTPAVLLVTAGGRIWLLSEWQRWLEATGRAEGRLLSFVERKAQREEMKP